MNISFGYKKIHADRILLPHIKFSAIRVPLPEADAVYATRSRLCESCPFPRHGLFCWGSDGGCLRSDAAEISTKCRA